MIARLRGRLDQIGDGWAVIDCGGVGYLAQCSNRTLDGLPPIDDPATLFIQTEVREDAINLYGFSDRQERDCFRLLLRVQGVGARVALAILSVLDPAALTTAVLAQDKAPILRADGVGPKLATRILSELKDRIGALAGPVKAITGSGAGPGAGDAGAMADAVSALANLGFGRAEALTAISTARRDLGDAATVEDLVRIGLRELSR